MHFYRKRNVGARAAAARGLCVGVGRAVRMEEEFLDVSQVPVYVRHEIVHNRSVVRSTWKHRLAYCEESEAQTCGAGSRKQAAPRKQNDFPRVAKKPRRPPQRVQDIWDAAKTRGR